MSNYKEKYYVVHFKTEECDDYYRVVSSKKKPTEKQLIEFFINNIDGDEPDLTRECSPVHEVIEVSEKKAIPLVNKK